MLLYIYIYIFLCYSEFVLQKKKKQFFLWRSLHVQLVAWRVIIDRLPMKVNLESSGIILESKLCVMCGAEDETTNNLFFKYKIVWTMWCWSSWWLGELSVFHVEGRNHFLHFFIGWVSKTTNKVWGNMWITVIGEIWK